MNKNGQLMGGFLVMITLILCGVVIGLFYVQQGNTSSSLVSAKTVLEVRDDLNLFEIREVELIEKSLGSVDKDLDFCGDEFSQNFKKEFLEGLSKEESMKEFIFSNLALEGVNISSSARESSLEFFENILYPFDLGECTNGKRSFFRSMVEKSFRLRVLDNAKINFPVDFSFEFEKEYFINEGGVVE